jgi:hypothetical protein
MQFTLLDKCKKTLEIRNKKTRYRLHIILLAIFEILSNKIGIAIWKCNEIHKKQKKRKKKEKWILVKTMEDYD